MWDLFIYLWDLYLHINNVGHPVTLDRQGILSYAHISRSNGRYLNRFAVSFVNRNVVRARGCVLCISGKDGKSRTSLTDSENHGRFNQERMKIETAAITITARTVADRVLFSPSLSLSPARRAAPSLFARTMYRVTALCVITCRASGPE